MFTLEISSDIVVPISSIYSYYKMSEEEFMSLDWMSRRILIQTYYLIDTEYQVY